MKWCAAIEWSFWSEIAPSVKNGVVTGIIVSAILGLFVFGKTWLVRRREVNFIRKFVRKGFENIGKVEDIKIKSPDVVLASAESIRVNELHFFLQRLASVAEHRTFAMKATQLTDLHLALSEAQNWETEYQRMAKHPKMAVPIGAFTRVYRLFSEIRWLKLPSNPPWE